MKEVDELIGLIIQGSDRQIDKIISDRLKAMIGKPVEEIKPDFLKCIDDCQAYSLSSGFVIVAMKSMYETMMDGKPEDYGCKIISHTVNPTTKQ